MIPASLQRVIEQRNEPRGITTLTWRDGSVLRQRADGTWHNFDTVPPLPQPQPQEDDDNPFPA